MNAVDSTMSLTTRQQFFAAYRRQLFSLPDSMIYFIAKNPKSSQVYQKMIQSCKYFRHKNPILVLHCLHINNDEWKTCSNKSECGTDNLTKVVNINIESLSGCKLWIQNNLRIHSTNPRCTSDLIPFMYQCDVERLWLESQKLSLQQFLVLSRNVIIGALQKVVLTSDVGTEVPLEDIIACLPFLKRTLFECAPESKNISSATVKKLVQIPHFKTIKKFAFQNISQKFDIDTFFDYYKKMETKFNFLLDYGDNLLSEEYARKIEDFITYVLGFPDQMPPVILYPGQNESNRKALWESHQKFY